MLAVFKLTAFGLSAWALLQQKWFCKRCSEREIMSSGEFLVEIAVHPQTWQRHRSAKTQWDWRCIDFLWFVGSKPGLVVSTAIYCHHFWDKFHVTVTFPCRIYNKKSWAIGGPYWDAWKILKHHRYFANIRDDAKVKVGCASDLHRYYEERTRIFRVPKKPIMEG